MCPKNLIGTSESFSGEESPNPIRKDYQV